MMPKTINTQPNIFLQVITSPNMLQAKKRAKTTVKLLKRKAFARSTFFKMSCHRIAYSPIERITREKYLIYGTLNISCIEAILVNIPVVEYIKNATIRSKREEKEIPRFSILFVNINLIHYNIKGAVFCLIEYFPNINTHYS